MTIRRVALSAGFLLALPVALIAQGGRGPAEPPKNLQVLPKDMPRQQVVAMMNTFTASLGVRCEHCHAEAPAAAAGGPPPGGPPPGGPPPGAGGPPPGGGRGGPPLDFASDAKEEKKIAREMLKMVNDINGKYLTLIGRTIADRNRVTCETCHHGLVRPRTLRASLAEAVEAKGADSSITLYRDLRTRYFGSAAYDFSEMALPTAALELSRMNQRPAGLALLKLNLEFYDKSGPTYQSMANLLLQGGDTAAAVDALKKGVAVAPNNPQLRAMMTRLGVTPP